MHLHIYISICAHCQITANNCVCMEWKAQDTVDDRSLLLQYFEELADDLATSFHVFISYRVASDRIVGIVL